MAAGDATWNPKKNVAYRVTFPILDADGDLVTGATGLDSEVSKDGGTFTDCTNEATEIATSSGVYYLDLTATEMNADTVAVIVKTTSSGAKTTVLVMCPLETADMPVDVLAISGDSVAADNLEAAADGTGYNLGGGSVVAASVTARVTANTDQLAGQTVTAANAVVFPSTVSSLTAAGVRSELQVELGRIDVDISSRLATSSYTTPPTSGAIADAVWDEATTGHTTAGTYGGQVLRGANSNVEVQVTGSNHVAADMHESQPGSIHATTFDAGAIDAAALATDAANEIADALLDRANAIETGLSVRGAFRLSTAALVGKLSGAATTTVTIRNVGDTTSRIVATVDENGNRTAVTTDAT